MSFNGKTSKQAFAKHTLAVFAAVAFVGCGDKSGKEDVAIAPPPAPSQGVSLAAAPEAAPPPAPALAPDGSALTAPPPPAPDAGAGAEDMFKGLTPQQIEDFKATATPETHDMNLVPLSEAVLGFAAEFKRAPANQEELVKARYLQRVLHPPKGKRYVIDPESMEVRTE